MPLPILNRLLLCALILLINPFPRPAAGAPRSPEDDAALRRYYSANGLLNRGLHDLAATEYEAFLEALPEHEHAPVARYGLGVCCFRLQRHDDAIRALAPLVENDTPPYAAEAAVIIGQSGLATRQLDRAAAALQTVLDRHADHELADDAAALLAEVQYEARRYPDAVDAARRLIRQWPQSPHRDRTALFGGLADMAQQKYAPAATTLSTLADRAPDGPYAAQAELLAAQCLHRANAIDDARTRYQRVIKRDRAEYVPDAMYGLALLLVQQNQSRAAAPLLDDLIRRFPKSALQPDARLLRGRVAFEQNDYPRARAQFEQAARATDGPADEAAYWLAKCALREDRPEDAASRLADALERHPRSPLRPEMTFDHAVALYRADEPEAALDQLETFRTRYAAHRLAPDALHLEATIQHQTGAYQASVASCAAFRAAHARHALTPDIEFLAAENLYLDGQLDDAADAYRAFLDEHPDDDAAPRASYRLGMALYRAGETEEAARILNEVIARADMPDSFRPARLALGDLAFQQREWSDVDRHLEAYLAAGLDQPAADDALLKLALAHQRSDALEDALLLYDRLLEAFPDTPHRTQAVFERGQTLVALDRPEDAEDAFATVLRDDADGRFTAHAANHLGVIAAAAAEHQDAAAYFARTVATTDDAALRDEARFQQAQSLINAEDYAAAEPVLIEILEVESPKARLPHANAQLAIVLARQGKHEAALDAVRRAERSITQVDVATRRAVAYENAWSLRNLDRDDEAIRAYDRLTALPGPSDLHCYAYLETADLHAAAKRHDEAARALRMLVETLDEHQPDDPDLRAQALYRLGASEYALKRHREAADAFESFLRDNPDHALAASALLLAGESRYTLGAHRPAAEHLRQVVTRYPDGPECAPALLRLGDAHAALQDWPASEKAFAQHLKRFPKSKQWYQARFGVGWALENQGRRDEAIAAYQQVIDRHQGATAARAQFQVGECRYAQKRYEDAVREFLRVDILYAYPEWSAAALYEAGRCFREMHDPVQARAQFELVQARYPDSRWARLADDQLALMADASLPGH